VGMLARSGRLDASTDGVRRREEVGRPIPLRGLHDLVPATQNLAALVERRPFSTMELRHFALMQAEHAHACAELVTDPTLGDLRRSFQERDLRYRQLAAATARTTSVIRPEGRPALIQLHEIRRTVENPAARRCPMGQLADYDAVQPEVSRALAGSINRALGAGWYLVVDDRQTQLAWQRTPPGATPGIAEAANRLRTSSAQPNSSADLPFQSGRLAARDLGTDQRVVRDQVRVAGARVLDVERARAVDSDPSADPSRRRLRAILDARPYGRTAAPNRVRQA
jgi:hypothetical protein